MKINSIYDEKFKKYGNIVEGYDVKELLETMEKVTPLPEKVAYVPEQKELQELKIAKEMSDRLFGGMPIQLGWCNGHNTKLNCLEYHRDSEVNIGTEDFILILGSRSKIDKEWMFDTKDAEAFFVPKGVMVEVYATTLHYAPCSVKKECGFRVLVVLPKGTNLEKPEFTCTNIEDTLLTARNKWLLAHPESDEARGGAVVGLKGINIDLIE